MFCKYLLLSPLLYLFLPFNLPECLAADWTVESKAWPEADQLFRRDTRWRGADAANSIDLGNGRVLWTFGDSFIDKNPDSSQRHRKTSKFIRNSIAIQVGYDPTQAEFHPYWQEKPDGTPTSFFRSEGEVYHWPCGGLMLNEKLLMFLMRVRNAKANLGFAVVGWGAVLVDNPQDSPQDWEMNFLSTPQNSQGVMVGSGSSNLVEDWVYSYGSDNTRRHNLFLTRVPVKDALAGDFSNLEWRNGSKEEWIKQSDFEEYPPEPIVIDGQTEFTVHYEAKLESFLLTQFKSFPRTPIAVRQARRWTGPWSPMRSVFVPTEAAKSRKDVMVYAAKAHPEQETDGLAVTYCSNTYHLATVRTNESLYYPRFVRFKFKVQADAN